MSVRLYLITVFAVCKIVNVLVTFTDIHVNILGMELVSRRRIKRDMVPLSEG